MKVSRPEAMVAAAAALKLLDAAEALGVSRGTLLEAAGLDEDGLVGIDARIAVERLSSLWTYASQRCESPALVRAAAERYQPSDYHLLGFVTQCSSTLGEAFEQLARYVMLWIDGASWTKREGDDSAIDLCYRLDGVEGEGAHRIVECASLELVHAARLVTGVEIRPTVVRFAWPDSGNGEVLRESFLCPVHFDGGPSAILVTPELLRTPLLAPDPALSLYLRGHAEELLSRRASSSSARDRARAFVLESYRGAAPSLAVTARALGLGERTLRRRLEEEGTSYRAVVDDVRKELALSYVSDTRLSLGEVAFLLGFSEVPAFHRAFKRWTGRRPAELRTLEAPRTLNPRRRAT